MEFENRKTEVTERKETCNMFLSTPNSFRNASHPLYVAPYFPVEYQLDSFSPVVSSGQRLWAHAPASWLCAVNTPSASASISRAPGTAFRSCLNKFAIDFDCYCAATADARREEWLFSYRLIKMDGFYSRLAALH